jgi:hypothetical protein
VTFAVVVQRRELIFVNLARIVQQAANQGTFPVIDAAAGQKTQQAFVLLRVQVASTPPSLAICWAIVVFMAAP